MQCNLQAVVAAGLHALLYKGFVLPIQQQLALCPLLMRTVGYVFVCRWNEREVQQYMTWVQGERDRRSQAVDWRMDLGWLETQGVAVSGGKDG